MLKIKFYRIKTLVVMEVLEQPEEIRGTRYIFRKGTFSIYSGTHPSLGLDTLYIRGDLKGMDNEIATQSFKKEEAAMKYIQNMCELIRAYNQSTEALEKKPISEVEETIAY